MLKFDTKLKGDIGEHAFILECLRKSWDVLKPIGDRLPYDIVLVINKQFIRIQVKNSWFDEKSQNYQIDNRRCKTNRRIMKHDKYKDDDFDFAVAYIEDLNVFYIFPIKDFNKFGGTISLVESHKRQRKAKSNIFRNNWELIYRAAKLEIV